MQTITNISTEVLKVHPRNTEFFDDIQGDEYERFKKSIKEEGVITPLIVTSDMTLISGHQRLKASRDLGIKSLPVVIREDIEGEDEKVKKLLASNFGRLKNNPMKQSKVISEYEKLCGIQRGGDRKSNGHNVALNQEDIAAQFGVDVKTIQRLKRLQELIPELQNLVEDGSLKPTTAILWTRLSKEDQISILNELGKDIIKEMTQKDVQEFINSDDDLIEQKLQAESEKREWYEKAQQYKREKEDKEQEVNQLKNAKPKTIIPDDYNKIKEVNQNLQHKVDELEKNLRGAQAVIKEQATAPKLQQEELNLEHFNSVSDIYLQNINRYAYRQVIFEKLLPEERQMYKDIIKKVTNYLGKIENIL